MQGGLDGKEYERQGGRTNSFVTEKFLLSLSTTEKLCTTQNNARLSYINTSQGKVPSGVRERDLDETSVPRHSPVLPIQLVSPVFDVITSSSLRILLAKELQQKRLSLR